MSRSTDRAAKPLPFKKRAERLVGRFGLRLLVGPLRAAPWPLSQKIGRSMGFVIYRLVGRYRRVALKNLELVYGADTEPATRKQMATSVFTHFGQVAAEFIKLPRLEREDIDRYCEVVGEENLCDALKMGRGVLLITGHFGNWEFMARWLSTHEYKLNVVARKASDPVADKLLFDTRTGSGAKVYAVGNAARGILECLKRQEIVAILPDQNSGEVYAPFFGLSTGTASGPAVIHLRTGAPLLFSWCVREADDRFRITYEPIEVYTPTGDREADVLAITSMINAHLEAQVRLRPTQWLWLHDRWRSSPEVFRALEERDDHRA